MMESDTWGFSACHPVEKKKKKKRKDFAPHQFA
jgi:hypothetical protein